MITIPVNFFRISFLSVLAMKARYMCVQSSICIKHCVAPNKSTPKHKLAVEFMVLLMQSIAPQRRAHKRTIADMARKHYTAKEQFQISVQADNNTLFRITAMYTAKYPILTHQVKLKKLICRQCLQLTPQKHLFQYEFDNIHPVHIKLLQR